MERAELIAMMEANRVIPEEGSFINMRPVMDRFALGGTDPAASLRGFLADGEDRGYCIAALDGMFSLAVRNQLSLDDARLAMDAVTRLAADAHDTDLYYQAINHLSSSGQTAGAVIELAGQILEEKGLRYWPRMMDWRWIAGCALSGVSGWDTATIPVEVIEMFAKEATLEFDEKRKAQLLEIARNLREGSSIED